MVAKYGKNKRIWRRDLILPVILGLILLTLICFLVNANLKLAGRRAELKREAEILAKDLQNLKEQEGLLEARISRSAQQEYLEQIARDARNLMKEGEKAVAIITPPDKEEAEKKEESKNFFRSILDWLR